MADSKIYHFKKGEVLLVDKPLNWTSFDVVNKIRYALTKKYHQKKFKVGHAGTLDPKATGLLILCTGKATKTIDSFRDMPKEYTGTLVLGGTRPSHDMETEIDKTFSLEGIDEAMVCQAAKKFTGLIKQFPPIFSAKKIKGQKAYNLARKGELPKMRPNTVEVFQFDLTTFRWHEVDFLIRCSKGTYIRSLAHDLGAALQNGAYLKTLRRTAIGEYSTNQANSIETWTEIIRDAIIDNEELN